MWDFILHQLKTNQFLSTAAVISILGSLALSLKSIPRQIYKYAKNRFIFSATLYQNDNLFYDFEKWFLAHHKEKYRDVEASLKLSTRSENPPSEQPTKNGYTIHYKQNDGVFLFKYKSKWIFISKNKKEINGAHSLDNFFFNNYTLSGIFAKEAIYDLLNSAAEFSALKQSKNEVRIYTHSEYGDWTLSGAIQGKSIDNIVMNTEIKGKLLNDIREFTSTHNWYNKASIMYKRGYLFHGDPGNGKTSLSFSIANELERSVYCLDLTCLINSAALKRTISSLNRDAILLIEDIDSFFKLRKNINDSKITFSTFINCLDGAFYREGLITIITTNHVKLIDPALMRTGRLDFHLELLNPGIEEINEYLGIFYQNETPKITKLNRIYSMSDIQDICLSNKQNPQAAIDMLQYSKEVNQIISIVN